MRFYTNENFPQQVVEALRKLGHDVLTSVEAGRANQRINDTEVVAFAHREERVLLTLNRKHFRRLHHAGHAHHGIIACTEDLDFERQARRIHDEAAKHVTRVGRLLNVMKGG